MKPELDYSTVLVVADNSEMLGVLYQVLTGRGHRVFLAGGAAGAARLLDLELGIDSVMIRAGLAGSESIERACLGRGVDVHFLRGVVEDGVIRLRLPETRSEYAPRFLIAGNQPAMRTSFSRHLTEDGYHVTAVESGGQALVAAQKTAFDAIVLGLSLPDIDDVEAIRRFRSDFPWLKILAVLCQTTGRVPRVLLTAGASGILGASATSWELREAVYDLLDPAGRCHGATPGAGGFRAASAGCVSHDMWGGESGRAVAGGARLLM